MVRHLHLTYNEDVFEELEAAKGNRTWEEAVAEEFGVDLE